MSKVWLQNLSWSEVEDALKACDVALIPVGSVEQHGRHLPEGTDTMVAISLAEDAAQRTGALIVPPLWFGWSPHHMALPGTISIRPEVLMEFVSDICRSLYHHGFKKLVIINGHRMVNIPWLQLMAGKLQEETGCKIVIVDPAYLGKTIGQQLGFGQLGHADELETSHMLHIHPDLVNMDKAKDHLPLPKMLYNIDPRASEDTLVYVPSRRDDIKKLKEISGGCVGEPTKATDRAGKHLHDHLVTHLVAIIEELQKT